MQKVEYKGKTVGSLGRFGKVTKGQVLDMDIYEVESVRDNPNFKILTENGAVKGVPHPQGTKSFDLRTLPWNQLIVLRRKLSFFSKEKRKSVVRAMNTCSGIDHDYKQGHTSREQVAAIVEAAYSFGWTALTDEEIANGGLHPEVEPSEIVKKPEPPKGVRKPKEEAKEEVSEEQPEEAKVTRVRQRKPKTRK